MRRFRRIIPLLLAAAAIVWLAGEWAVRNTSLPEGLNHPPPVTPFLVDRQGRTFSLVSTTEARESYPLKLRNMGEWLPAATVAVEDHRFWRHHGIDWHAALGAAARNLKNGRIVSGASTITQQVIKITTGRKNRTLRAKFSESLAALKLDRTWDKRKILETYLNRLDYGNRRIGPEAAARAYFGKSARDLTLPEAIFLAGLPQSPARLNPWKNPAAALARYQRNVRRLAADNLLPPGANPAFLQSHPPAVERHDPPNEAPHFAELAGNLPAGRGGVLQTTLDLNLQKAVERLLREHLRTAKPLGVGDAAIVILDNATGDVLALACAGDPRHASINSATAPRSCGSTLKPFIYLSAIDRRQMTAATLLPDTPDAITETYQDYDPQNYSKRFFGPVRLREALGNSLNVPAVVTVGRLGARDAFAFLGRWGLNFPEAFEAYGAGFILGNAPVRLLDLAGAYAALARGGRAWDPKFRSVSPKESRQAASPASCAILTDILCDNEARRLSFGNGSLLNLDARVAVKTGTSSGFRDGWCVGFDRQHTVAVWTGNLDGQPMGEMLAVRSAAPLWHAVMRHLLASGDTPLPALTESPELRSVEVAAETGLLPRPGEPVVREVFLAGTEPKESAGTLYENGVLCLPAEYAAWCAGPQNRLGAKVRSENLKILFPRDRAQFVFNPHLPAGQQKLIFNASLPGCRWKLNGQEAGDSFVLQPGQWILTAEKDGRIAKAEFVVE